MNIKKKIKDSLDKFNPSYLSIVNESYMHSRGNESHFKITIVSKEFCFQSKVKQHQMIYLMLGSLMDEIHALALHTYTPEEYKKKEIPPSSPRCIANDRRS